MKTSIAWKRKLLTAAFLLGCALSEGLQPAASAWIKPSPPTMFQLCEDCEFALVVRVLDYRSEAGKWRVKLAIEEVIKAEGDFFKDKKTMMLSTSVELPEDARCIVLCNREQVTQYVTIEAGSAVKDYLLGAVKLKDKMTERYRYVFDFLEHKEGRLAADAFHEFARLRARDLAQVARGLPAEKLAALVADSRTAHDRRQFYGFLLGHCGTAEHARLLRSKIAESTRREDVVLTGFLKGYVLLQPTEGWAYLQPLLADRTQPARLRQSAIDTAAFVLSERPDLVERKELVRGMSVLLEHADTAEGCVASFRANKVWEQTVRVLVLYDRGKNLDFHLNRAVLRFAFESAEPRAAAFVSELAKSKSMDVSTLRVIVEDGVFGPPSTD